MKRFRIRKRFLSGLLVLVMVFALLPGFTLTAYAANGGTVTNPTIINASIGVETLNSGYYELRGTFTNSGRLTVNGDVHLILQDGCDVIISGGINCWTGNSLTIAGNTGKLTANNAPDGQAGIGGDNAWNSYSTSATATGGNITINGGIITATGGSSTGSYGAGAGIGGGHDGEGGNITIGGGTVTATGGIDSYSSGSGAGIGGGDGCAGGTITIKGGTVTANGGNSGAGIGGGAGGEGGSITIDDGTITATGGSSAAGIGGGDAGGGTITIGGGTIIATGGYYGAGIGGGSGDEGGTITIDGGSITAIGGDSSAGIGGGASGDGGTITIGGGAITATGGTYGAGIGGGWSGAGGDITISGGTVTATMGSSSGNGDIGPGWSSGSVDGTVSISGGSVNCANGIVPRPTNDGTAVYLNKLYKTSTLNNAAITDIYGVSYGVDDVVADASGNLYFWLPASSASEIIAVSTDGTNFHGANYQRKDDDTNVAELVLSLTREATPSAAIDYVDENLTGLSMTAKYTINGADITLDGSGNIAIDSAWFGTTLSIVCKTSNPATIIDSAPQSLFIPLRPNGPGGLVGVAITEAGLSDGKITGTMALMEWNSSEIATSGWQTCDATETTGFAVGTYYVRYKAVASGSPAFTSTATVVTITDPLPKVYPVLTHFGTWTGSGTSFAKVDAVHTKFVRLLYGDAEIASSNYTITQGSTIITLNEAHLQTYANGTHWFVAEYLDGTSEKIRLDVNVAAASTPQTGDSSNMAFLWVALICAATLGILCLIIRKKRQREASK